VSKRKLTIHVHAPRGATLASFTVTINGRRLATKGRTSVVSLRGLPKGTFTVQITVRTRAGMIVKGRRIYHTCVAGKKKKRRR